MKLSEDDMTVLQALFVKEFCEWSGWEIESDDAESAHVIARDVLVPVIKDFFSKKYSAKDRSPNGEG